ncbi:MAG: hypothetical protein PUJ25_00845 [Lachnospiraceae bacterium]|jgi:hypothetical protein|nr:hypothetical protein [Lachnospiraceae bacterium]MDD7664138.1 hypothetical protein [Lachnospiraceae bacterium]MDY4164492.1 hypothetical protein [Lachnospiraceae bacterium]
MRNDIPYLDPDEPEAVDLPELSMIEEGMVFDVLSESDNDGNGDYCEVATQEDMDNW